MKTNWKYTDATQRVVSRTLDNGGMESCFSEVLEIDTAIEPADIPPPPTYQDLRATEYNRKSTGEQFGMMFDDRVNGTTTWIEWQQGIKDRIPK